MGLVLSSAMDTVKRNSPDLTPVTDAYRNSHDFCLTTVDNISTQKLKEFMPGQEKISRALIHPATKQLLTIVVPGGAQAYNVLEAVMKDNPRTHSLNDGSEKRGSEKQLLSEQIQVLQAENQRLQAELERMKESNLAKPSQPKPSIMLRSRL